MFLEQFPAWEGNHPHALAIICKFLCGIKNKAHFRARSHQNNFRYTEVFYYIRAFFNLHGGVQCWNILTSEYENCWPISAGNRHAPGLRSLIRIRGPQRRKVCDEKLELVDLDFKRDAYANTLSRGQTQRLGLARVLLHDPQVLLLDEPLSGLDPRARIEMRSVLRRLGQQGKTIMVSSHILPELADICNKVGIIDRGVMSVNATVADVMKQVRQRIVLHIDVTGDQDAAAKLLQQSDAVDGVEIIKGLIVVSLKPEVTDYADLSSLLFQAGHKIKLFREEEFNLESAFMALTKGLGTKI